MIWRDAKEKPRVSGKYQVLVKYLILSPFSGDVDFATFSVWYSTNQGQWEESGTIIAWLDPEIPEKYLAG